MQNITPMLTVSSEHLPRLGIFMSGSGSNAEKILARAARDDTPPFTIAALVTDAPETSRARELGQQYDVPVVENDIRAFYRERGVKRVTIATPEGQQLREEWTDSLRAQLKPLAIDFAVFAGFVPLTNLTGDLPCLNVHPGDLTYLKDGSRYLVGLHTVPIERAILEGLDALRSSVIQALPYSGKGDDMDNGPILGISGPVPIDLKGASLDDCRACRAARPEKRPKGGYQDMLADIAELNQENLKVGGDWVVLPQVTYDFARGKFGTGEDGKLYFRMGKTWHPIDTVVYGQDEREILFRDA